MAERRKTKRKYLMFYTRVFDQATEKLLGHLVDITPEGAMLISEAPVPTQQAFRLRMELSGDVADKPALELEAFSLWCNPDVNPQFYNTGFQLRNVPPEDVDIINRIIESYGFRDNAPL